MTDLERLSAEELLGEALDRHHPRLVTACSFQKEDSVVIDMLMRLEPSSRVFMIDTGVLFSETYQMHREVERSYGISVEVVAARASDGTRWASDRCCGAAKVAALDEALADVDAWVTGIRREQSPFRGDTRKAQFDPKRSVWKYNPLADWSEEDVWAYIRRHSVPYHPLHDRGYGSIGCEPCTQQGAGREGRWAGQDRSECGLHL